MHSSETGDATIRMKPHPEPSTQEVLAGVVERVTYHNEENGFCVLRIKARGHRDLVTVVGHAAGRVYHRIRRMNQIAFASAENNALVVYDENQPP